MTRARNKKKPTRSTSRPPSQHEGGEQSRGSRTRSQLRAARGWIIGVLLAGLAASISAVMVNLTQTGLSPLTTVTGPSQTADDNSGPILTVQVAEGWNSGDCLSNQGPGWVFPASSASVASAVPGTGIRHQGKTWDQNPPAFDAVAASDIKLNIIAYGPSPHTIVLTGMKFRIIRRWPALRGVLVTEGSYYISDCSPAIIQDGYVNLDTSSPAVRPSPSSSAIGSGSNGERTAPLLFPYTISDTNPEIFTLIISTQKFDCTWTAELDWTVGSKVGHTLIEDNGRPFETTTTTALRTVNWIQNSHGRWSRS